MYPTLYHALLDLTGIDLPFLKFLNSFGFFVAVAFVVANRLLAAELRRKAATGLLRPSTRTVTIGLAARPGELVLQGLLGFVLGWKGLYLLLHAAEATADTKAFLFSGTGSLVGGVAGAALLAGALWWEKRKQRLDKPRTEQVVIAPEEHAGAITMTAALWGVIGAKLFHWLENPDELAALLRDPRGADLFTGLTMYGGLILAGAMVMRYFRRHGMPVLAGADAAAPGVMLAYAIGRIGCQVSGDGDWGIVNTTLLGPGPRWLWQYDYPNNVNGVGIPITDGRACFEGYCTVLPETVFPTPLYETLACTLFFGVLWALRGRLRPMGAIFFLFLLLNGLERFWIEKIRVNVLLFGDTTQAELIALLLMLAGAAGLWAVHRARNNGQHGPQEAH
ncbi:MAG: prolipoprotein diacylglyceryl transferase [Flavobacteriales bacterium]|nr:Prolipoprotein diacylglyceryl transferase [Flavobacteriales bacterium]MCC6578638.1 prolipoprotein diacylglyceryl transferase [Flavobacteriales bacterium]NUQ14522.1 prolipoprotein diacylglyceryl transferase [Flavobacteriales bacterium]